MTERRIAIVGAGAIGGWLAARLSHAGHCVSLLVRRGRASAYGDALTLIDGAEQFAAPVTVSEVASALGEQDILIFATKAFVLADAAEAAQPLIGPATVIMPMMNGVPWWFTAEPLVSVDPDGRIASLLPRDQVEGCVVHAAAKREAANRIAVQKVDHLIFGAPSGGSSAHTADLVAMFETAGIPARASEDIRSAIWYKLWGNMTVNPLSALTLATADRLCDELGDIMLSAMEEARTIGAAIGCPISESGEARLEVTRRLGAFKTSMLQDVEAGRPVELDALLGAPLEFARRHALPAPTLTRLDALTRLMAESRGLLA